MKGMSSPILSPQFLTRSDFFVVISTAITVSPVTTDDSMETDSSPLVSSVASVVTDSEISSPVNVVGVDGVVVRRVNRILFVLTISSAVGVVASLVASVDSHASKNMKSP